MPSALRNRDTRVQIVIVENGQYVLIEHLAKKENMTFWGLPGGGRESDESDEDAAIREALEETGLTVRLLPIKHEMKISGKGYVYNRIVTFMAYPVSGEAKTGYEPEEELDASYNYTLIGLKWQNLHDDSNLEDFTKNSVKPVRELLKTTPLKRQAGGLLYQKEGEAVRFLIARVQNGSHHFDLPRWNIKAGKSAEDIIKQKSMDNWGVAVNDPSPLGFFFHEAGGEFYRNDIFSMPLFPGHRIPENDMFFWIDANQAGELNLSRESKRIIGEFDPNQKWG
jgi:8-oxo-dGTP pyrophosphatase MutT (NUDIX family)